MKKWWLPIAAYVVSCPTRAKNLKWYLININSNSNSILFPHYKYLSLGNNSNIYWFSHTDTAKKMSFKLVSFLVCLKIEFAKHPLLICWWRKFFWGGFFSLSHHHQQKTHRESNLHRVRVSNVLYQVFQVILIPSWNVNWIIVQCTQRWNFGVLNFPKKQCKNLKNFYPT